MQWNALEHRLIWTTVKCFCKLCKDHFTFMRTTMGCFWFDWKICASISRISPTAQKVSFTASLCKAQEVPSIRRSIARSPTMPNQSDVLQTIKAISEQVMESLKALLFLLVSLVEIHNTTQPVPQERSDEMMQLLSEVRSQKSKIDEISSMLRNSPSPRRGGFQAVDLDQEWEVASQVTSVAPTPPAPPRAPSRAAKGSTTMTNQPPAVIQQISPSTPQTPQSVVQQEHQIVAVNTDLVTCGQKCICWGRKWPGTWLQEVYVADPNYVQWIADRTNSPPMRDFHMYCQCRRRVESQA